MGKLSKQLLQAVREENTSGKQIYEVFNKLFLVPRKESEIRKGLHGSELDVKPEDWCLRQALLKSLECPLSESDHFHGMGLIRIFRAGDSIHEKWQEMFELGGETDLPITFEYNEARSYSKEYGFYLTPDAIIQVGNVRYIVEIKSVGMFPYNKSTGHAKARKQCQPYMYMWGIPKTIILEENKNNQEFRIEIVDFDIEMCRTQIGYLEQVKKARETYFENGDIPDMHEWCKKMMHDEEQLCNSCSVARHCLERMK